MQYTTRSCSKKWLNKIILGRTTFSGKSPTFSHSFRTRNISTTFSGKSPTFGHSYRTRNISRRSSVKSPTFGHSYWTRNILTRFCRKSPSFGKSFRTRNILTRFSSKSPSFGKFWRFDREAFDSVEPLHGYLMIKKKLPSSSSNWEFSWADFICLFRKFCGYFLSHSGHETSSPLITYLWYFIWLLKFFRDLHCLPHSLHCNSSFGVSSLFSFSLAGFSASSGS